VTTEPNTVLFAVAALAGAAALGVLILAAEAHGRRRQQRKAWLMGPGGNGAAS
jgi:phage/plasmid-associated DNA primase